MASSDEDMQTLGMYYEAKDLVVSATRHPKPLSQSAENITVITAKDIEMMGAHTIADILNNVPGIQIDDRGSVGTFSGITIQGSDFTHILLMIDGVMLNFFSDSTPDIAAVPVQNIDRIEVSKGPGSSSWGPALGGVINIVTKSPIEDKKIGGMFSASIGEEKTRDIRGEASGTVGSFGYYLNAGQLASDGLGPHTGVDLNNLYGKLRWDMQDRGSLLLTLAYAKDTRGDGQFIPINDTFLTQHRYFLSTLSMNYALTERMDLDISFRSLLNRNDRKYGAIDPSQPSDEGFLIIGDETSFGGSAKLTWRQGIQSLAVGVDYDSVDSDTRSNQIIIPPDSTELTLHSDKWGVFLNEILYLNSFTLTPGLRYDRMNPVGDFFSPSLGVAWNPTENMTLRLYGARGYSLPLLQSDATQEKVWTLQIGAETTLIPHIWLKSTFFLNYLSDVYGTEKQKKQGFELEGKTAPLFDTSLSFGYTFINSVNRDTGETLKDSPRHILKMGVHYNYGRSFRGALLGRYVDWNSTPDYNARNSAMIWDLNLAKKFHTTRTTGMELFFNIHNLFSGAQYLDEAFTNAGRWFEGGLRFDF